MKGVVFTEFLTMVEKQYSEDMVDDVIDDAELPSGGAYTAVGTYDHKEMVQLLVQLSKKTGIDPSALLNAFGHHLFVALSTGYPQYVEGMESSFEVLDQLEPFIHVEVKKLYPDAELPEFETTYITDDAMGMIYRSPRCLGDLCQGLMEACFAAFKENIELSRADEAEGRIVRFDHKKVA